jgi:cytoskeletal protein RodZ
LIALAVAGVVVLAAVGIALWILLADDGADTTAAPTSSAPGTTSSSEPRTSTSERTTSSSPRTSATPPQSEPAGELPPATVTPDGLGEDPVMDAYAQDCYAGDMVACDSLYFESEPDSAYEVYGDTCAGRQPPGTDTFCTESFPNG